MPGQRSLHGVNPKYHNLLNKEDGMSNYQAAKIEKVLLINGSKADNYSDNDLIELVKREQKAVDELREVKPESQHIQDRIAKHEAAVLAIVNVLDTRKVEPFAPVDAPAEDG